jgi:hypothetical protein
MAVLYYANVWPYLIPLPLCVLYLYYVHMFILFMPLSFAGIAFPTSVSVNNCVCHFSPLRSDAEIILKDGDLVKM